MAEGESIGLDEYLAQLGELRLVEPVSLENLVGRSGSPDFGGAW